MGWLVQRTARQKPFDGGKAGGVGIHWSDVSHFARSSGPLNSVFPLHKDTNGEKTNFNGVGGHVGSGSIMAILGPSGAGKIILMELIAGKAKSEVFTGSISFPPLPSRRRPRVAFVPETNVLTAFLTLREA